MNISLGNIFRTQELRDKILLTVGLLAVYRLGIFVTTPGVDRSVMSEIIGGSGGFLGLFNLFSGGALEQMSVFALGVMPYISASIIFQLLAMVYPPLERLNKEGEPGRRKVNQYTRYATVVISLLQGFFIANFIVGLNNDNPGLLVTTGPWFYFVTVLTLTTGTAFLMWLGEQITERGIGNGMSLIIFAGIISGLPAGVFGLIEQTRNGDFSVPQAAVLAVLALGVIFGIVYIERAQRRIPVQYAKGGAGRVAASAQSSYLPLKLNPTGVIPPIFASSILLVPASLAGNFPEATWAQSLQAAMNPLTWQYNTLYVVLIVFFAFFYAAATVNTVDIADGMRRQNSFIPGVRPGKLTAEYIDRVLTRLVTAGSIYLAAVCVMPVALQAYFPVPFFYGGTSLLIVVSVGLDTMSQIEGQLITRNYEALTPPSGGRIRDRVDGTPDAA